MIPTREDLELYVMGCYDGDVAALEAHVAEDDAARAIVADESALELALRDMAAAATFCPACDDVVRGDQCATCGAVVRVGGYTIERVLVQNTHGRMYVARDVDGRRVALKELAFVQAPGADAHAAFEREARFLRALDHPSIPRFVASFEEGRGVHTRYYLAQELVAGVSLDARLDDHFFDEKEITELARSVLTVLVYLQSVSPMIVHRDIKPANLLRRPDGTIAVVDFGAAHVGGSTIGSTSIGTFGYMPIEQMVGQIDATTDTYALGASLLHLLTRREPWKLLQAPDWDAVNVSPALRAFLRRLVASEPRDRFASAADALAALGRVERGEARVIALRSHTRRSFFGPLALVASALLALGGAGVIGFWAGSRPHAVSTPHDSASGVRLSATPRDAIEMTATVEPYTPPPPRGPNDGVVVSFASTLDGAVSVSGAPQCQGVKAPGTCVLGRGSYDVDFTSGASSYYAHARHHITVASQPVRESFVFGFVEAGPGAQIELGPMGVVRREALEVGLRSVVIGDANGVHTARVEVKAGETVIVN